MMVPLFAGETVGPRAGEGNASSESRSPMPRLPNSGGKLRTTKPAALLAHLTRFLNAVTPEPKESSAAPLH